MDQLLRTNQRAKVATSVRRLHQNIVKHPTDQHSRDDIAMISNLVIVDHVKWPRWRYWSSTDGRDEDLVAVIETLATCEGHTMFDRAVGELDIEKDDTSLRSLDKLLENSIFRRSCLGEHTLTYDSGLS